MSSRILLALDLGAKTGVAVGSPRGKPEAFSWRFSQDDPGARFTKLRGLLERAFDQYGVTDVAYEEPIVSNVFRQFPILLALFGYVAHVEEIGNARGVAVIHKPVNTIRKGFTGNGRSDKDAIQLTCRRLGWIFENNNESDALALWSVVAGEISPMSSRVSAPLFSSGTRHE